MCSACQYSTYSRRGTSSICSCDKTPSSGCRRHGQTRSTSQYSSWAILQDFDIPDNNLGTSSRGKHKDKDKDKDKDQGKDKDKGKDGQPKE